MEKHERQFKAAEMFMEEWKHRDSGYYKYATILFSCSIVVSLFPYVEFTKGALPFKQPVYAVVGSIVAIIATLLVVNIARRSGLAYSKYKEIVTSIDDGEYKHIEDSIKIKVALFIPIIVCIFILFMNLLLLCNSNVEGKENMGDITGWVGNIIGIVGVVVAVFVFIATSKSEKRAIEEQTHRESVRATLSELSELRRVHSSFKKSFDEKEEEEDRNELIRDYLTDVERFAVGCNSNAYDAETMNKMCGGLILNQYATYFKPYIDNRRNQTEKNRFVKSDDLYKETDEMIKALCKIRGVDYDKL